jgi:Bifunctional DNA primase/polymerase, N-terminal
MSQEGDRYKYSPTDDLIQEASILMSWGFPVFPLVKKVPACRWKHFQSRRPSDREIDRLFRLPGVDGIAAVTGAASGGFAVRDFDRADAYHQWTEAQPQLARSIPTVRTKRGFHVWHRSSEHFYKKLGNGEYIGDSLHFACVPPTRHPEGVDYVWLNGPPIGVSDFPVINPGAVGLLTRSITPSGAKPDIRHSSSSLPSLDRLPDSEPVLPDPVYEAVIRNLPGGPGERNEMLFRLARTLKDHVGDDSNPGLLHDAVRVWWLKAYSVIRTKEFTTTIADFRRAWSQVRTPMSQSPPMLALARGASRCGTTRQRLLRACHALAVEVDGQFYLSARTAAGAVGLGKSQAAVHLRALVSAGDLIILKKGIPSRLGRTGTTWYTLPPAKQ